MINTAAMLGLGNDPALKELAQVKAGIQVLFKLKEKDYKEMQRESRREKEQDKREAQDINRILNSEAKEIERIKAALKTSQGGLMAALLGGAALLGAIGIVKGFNLGEFISDLKDNLVALLGMKKVPTKPTMEEDKVQNQDTSGTDDGQELGDLSNLEAGDPNFKGLPMPDTVAVTSKMGMRGGRLHAGVDIGGVGGEKLTVSRPSQVVESRWYSGYGNTVIFKDNRGEHLYAHMRALSKYKKGDVVQPGQTIGILGNTGRSSGPHLHWEFSPRLGEVGTQGRRLKDVSDPTKTAGMTWKTPFIGKQVGGQIGTGKRGSRPTSGQVVNKAAPIIMHHEALSSLTPGVNDYIFHGGTSVKSKTPWAKANKPDTKIHAYPDSGKVPTIGWGSIYNDSMLKGKSKVKMGDVWPKSKADTKLKSDSAELLAYLKSKHPFYGKMTLDQQAGFLSQHYNTGAYTATDSSKYPKFKSLFRAGKVHEAAKAHPRSGGAQFANRIKDEQKYMMNGPATYPVGKQRGGIVNQPPVHRFQSGGNVAKTGKTPELYEKYNDKFIGRQARKATNAPIIIVNNTVAAPQHSLPQPAKPLHMDGGAGESMPSYNDIAQSYYRYVGGIKV